MADISNRIDHDSQLHDAGIDRHAFGALALALFVSLAISTLIIPAILLALAGGVLLLAGLAMAAGIWWRGAAVQEKRTSQYDVAALLVFLGFAASIMSGPASQLV